MSNVTHLASALVGERVHVTGTTITGVVTDTSTPGFVIVTSDLTGLRMPIHVAGLELLS